MFLLNQRRADLSRLFEAGVGLPLRLPVQPDGGLEEIAVRQRAGAVAAAANGTRIGECASQFPFLRR